RLERRRRDPGRDRSRADRLRTGHDLDPRLDDLPGDGRWHDLPGPLRRRRRPGRHARAPVPRAEPDQHGAGGGLQPAPAPPGGRLRSPRAMTADEILRIDQLRASYMARSSELKVVDGLDLSIRRGEIIGIAGESGSGKTTLVAAVLRLLRPPGRI